MLISVTTLSILLAGLQVHRKEGKAISILNRAFAQENLYVYGKLLMVDHSQDQDNRGHGLYVIPGLMLSCKTW